MAPVSYEDVWKSFDGTVAVREFSLEIPDGEFMVLVGPSGCGKSTALRMLAGLEEISRGRILIGERVVNNIAPASRDVAMVFQSYALYPHMTVYDNLAFGLRNRGLPRREIDQRVRRAGDILQLGDLLRRKPKQLSGGQRQRVALGRAIVREPVAFLMDEPLSNLDAKLRVETRAELLKLQRTLGTTTIYVTHDQVEAMTMGDRIAVMNAGVLQQVGTPEELYTRPRNLFVAGFIGSPAMNLVPAPLLEAGGPGQIAGVRPEHIEPEAAAQGGDHVAFTGRVEVTEYLGDEQIVHLLVRETPIVAKVHIGHRLPIGEEWTFSVARDQVRLFDAETGEVVPVLGQADPRVDPGVEHVDHQVQDDDRDRAEDDDSLRDG
jgi:ABC-type sugar transport system ATPase subunit